MDQFEYILTVPVVKHCFLFCRLRLNVDLSIYDVYGNQFVNRFRKNNESVKKWGTSDFSWTSNFSGLLIPLASGKFGLISTPEHS